MRKHTFTVGEYYHIFNRGVDKRAIVEDREDIERFIKSCTLFNTTDPIGSIYELSFRKGLGSPTSKLVLIISYCINPNHFHFLLSPLVEKGVEKFMQRLGGYTKYFNEKYRRSGSLFQGKFKSKHITDDTYLLHVSAYINLNNRDSLGSPTSKLSCSSFGQYGGKREGEGYPIVRCNPDIILSQFPTHEAYIVFAKNAWLLTQEVRNRSEKIFDFLPENMFLS